VGALLLAVTFYIRYKQVAEQCRSYQIERSYRAVNNLSLLVGWSGALGLSVIANFQETEVYIIHKLGLYLCFGCGLVWLWCSVLLSWSLSPFQLEGSCCTELLRTVLALLNTSTFISTMLFAEVARSQFHGDDPAKWGPEDGGWDYHIVSTVSEWVMALSLDLAILTLTPDFSKLQFEEPKIIVNVERRGFLNAEDDDEFQNNSLIV